MKAGVLASGVSQDLGTALARIRQDGFTHVEIQYAWGVEDGGHTPAQLRTIKALLEEYGMHCTATLRNLFSALRLDETHPSSPPYREELRRLEETIMVSRFLGNRLTRINSFNKQNVLFGYGGAQHHLSGGNKVWHHYLRLMEPVCRMAEEAGIDVMVETGTGGLIHSAALAQKAARELASPRFKVLWDPANCLYSGEEPLEGYGRVRDHLAEVHIKDLRLCRPLAEVTYCPLGQGLMAPHLEILAAALRADGFPGAAILENQVTPPGGTELDGYRQSVPLFRRLFGRQP